MAPVHAARSGWRGWRGGHSGHADAYIHYLMHGARACFDYLVHGTCACINYPLHGACACSAELAGEAGGAVTLAMLVQLRDPKRGHAAVGQPMIALVTAEKVGLGS